MLSRLASAVNADCSKPLQSDVPPKNDQAIIVAWSYANSRSFTKP